MAEKVNPFGPAPGSQTETDDPVSPLAEQPESSGIQLPATAGSVISQQFSDSFTSSSGSSGFGRTASGKVNPFSAAPGSNPFSSQAQSRLPATDEQFGSAISSVLAQASFESNVSPWHTVSITQNLQKLTSMPEAQFVLSNPEIIGEWQQAIWGGTLDAMSADFEGTRNYGSPDAESTQFVGKFFKDYGDTFSQEERQALHTILAHMPNGQQMLEEKGITPRATGGWWGADLWNSFTKGLDVVAHAPEAIKPVVNDPRSQLVSQLTAWLSNNPLESMEDREKFFTFAIKKTQAANEEVEANSSGFFRIVQQTVDLAPTAIFNAGNDWLQQAANPDEFALRQHLSIGQNFAASLGVDPSEEWYGTTSGFVDGFAQIVLDPNNLFFGVANGIKNASQVPRTLTRGQALRVAVNPFGGKTLGLPVLDRGLVSRFAYAAFSKDVDAITNTAKANRAWNWISKSSSATEIAQRFPDIGAVNAEHLSKLSEPWQVREVVRAGLQGGVGLGWDAPLKTSKVQAGLGASVRKYADARAERFADPDVSLHVLDPVVDKIDPSDVYRAPVRPDALEVVGDAVNDEVIGDVLRNVSGIPGRNIPGAAGGEEVSRLGDISIRSDGNGRFAAVGADGAVLGGVTIPGSGIGVVAGAQGRGVGSALLDAAEAFDPDAIAKLADGPRSQAFVDLVNRRNLRAFEADVHVFNRSALTNDGGRKAVVSQVGTPITRTAIDIQDGSLVKWLETQGEAGLEVSTQLALGGRLADLSNEGRSLIVRYGDAVGSHFLDLGDEMIPTAAGRKAMLTGVDNSENVTKLADEVFEAGEMQQAAMRHLDLQSQINGNILFIKQLPDVSWTRRTRQALSTSSTKGFMAELRRRGFSMTSSLPSNISLTDTNAGSKALRDWAKALGATDEVANSVSDAFIAATPATRKDVILRSMEQIGDNIENPLLKNGLITWGEKQGDYTYFYDRAGRELGQAADGSIMPMSLAHFTDNFAMPEAKSLLQSVRRYKGANGPIPHITRGLFDSTQKSREVLARNLKARLRRTHGDEAVAGLSDEDFMKMAYADVLAAGSGNGRPAALGYLNKAASMAGNAYKMLHHVFVIAQLAGRPIAWTTRVLMEETLRAEMFAMPSVWKNPTDYMSKIWEASAIRKLPARQAAQAEVAEGLVNGIFASGATDWNRLEKVMPDVRRVLDDANIDPGDADAVRAYVSHLIGSEMMGDRVTDATIGLRGNVTRRAWLRDRKIKRTVKAMDENNLTKAFDWDMDGVDIANRSFHQSFVKEAGAASVPLDYKLGAMTPEGIHNYGRSYGRQVYQMLHNDPIVRSFGLERAYARALGQTPSQTGASLVQSSSWANIEHIVDRRAAADGITFSTNVEKADYYLDNFVDEMVETLFRPLAKEGDPEDYARIIREMKKGSVSIDFGSGVPVKLNASASNYEGFVQGMGRVTQEAYNQNINLPTKVSSWFDPRFGQEDVPNAFRRASDWAMMHFGENPTQKLNRQPAWLATHKSYFEHYKALGWEDDVARAAATEKATQLVNYVFFDNKNIPQFLRSMNQVVPFFSAMWEVSSTWAYKIPSQSVLPVGYAQLLRRTSRTLQGLVNSGLVDRDPETGQMTLSLSANMANANDPVTSLMGKAMFQWMRLPLTITEYIGGLSSFFDDEEGFMPANLSAWGKDGFQISIGNPLDPTTHGLMAVNQFSIGLSPTLQMPLSMGANAVFAQSDTMVDAEGTLADYIVDHPDEDIQTMLRYNREAFIEVNGTEKYKRALSGDADILELNMPASVRIHETSTWETLVDKAFFPFGKTEHLGEVLTSVSPAAMNYIWRGLFQKLGAEDDSEIMGMLFGQMSNYQVSSEIITQLQMLEASEGTLSKAQDLATEITQKVAAIDAEVWENPDGANRILDADSPEAEEINELLERLEALNFDTMKRANDNAAGALMMRGIMGQLGPVTPRMWLKEQDQVAQYWQSRDVALEAEKTGSVNFAEQVRGMEINGIEDMVRLFGTTQAWLDDPSGDKAKVFMFENNPSLRVFTQGKTYWGPGGPPPQATGFDQWVDQLEAGEREPFDAEVFMARYQRAGIGLDKEIALIEEYGNDPDLAAQAILADYGKYRDTIEPFNMQYEAHDFLDHHLYEGKYAAWRDRAVDNLSAYELVVRRVSDTQEDIDGLQDLLQYAELSPDERRRIGGALSSTVFAHTDAVRQLEEFGQTEGWLNPRELVLNQYWEEVSNPYYEERSKLFDLLDDVQNGTERSRVFDAVRLYDNQWFLAQHTIDGVDGNPLTVPSPMLRSWNAKSQEERQELLMKSSSKKPEWLNLFEVSTLVHNNPAAATYLPDTMEKQQIYDQVAFERNRLIEAGTADPENITPYMVEQAIKEVEEAATQHLLDTGREGEVLYAKALPIQKVNMLGLLPQSLAPVVPHVNAVMSDLAALEKSPTSNVGREKFLQLREILEQDYFRQNPQAKIDFMQLGLLMFDETLPSAIYARLFQGSFFGELR